MIRASLALLTFCILLSIAPRLAAQDTPQSAQFKLAVDLYDDGLYAQAEDQFRTFIERYPTSASAIEARYYLATLLRVAKKYGEARGAFQEFALRYSEHPRAADAWWNLGEIFALEHDYGEAGQAFSKLKTFHPKNARAAEALLQAGKYFLLADDTENARTVLNAIMLEYPNASVRYEAQMSLGRLYLAQGAAERALREYQRLLAEAIPADMRPKVIVAIGETQAALGNRAEAEAKYREVISTYSTTAAASLAQVKLGDLQREFREYGAARESYERVAANAQADVALRRLAYAGLAETAGMEGDDESALQAWTRLFDLQAESAPSPELTRRAASTARRAGAYTQAQTWLERLLADTLALADPRGVFVELAQTAREGKNPALALAQYQSYLRRYPDDAGAPEAMLQIADIEERDLQNYTAALEHYAAVPERFGVSRVADDALFGQARTLEKQGNIDKAIDSYRQLLVQYPASEKAADARTAMERLQLGGGGDVRSAVEQLAGVIGAMQERSADGAVELLLARVYLESIGDYVRAERYFDAALAKGVTGEDAEDAAFGAALSALRLAALGRRGLEEAAQRCDACFASYPSGARHDALAWELFRTRSAGASAAEVLTAAASFLARNPASHREQVLIASGMAQLELGRLAEAGKEFTTVIDGAGAAEAAADALFGRAQVLAAQQQFEAALRDLDEYHRVAPGGSHAGAASMLRARLLSRVGRYPQAIDGYEAIISRYPYAALADSARIALPSVLLESGQTRDAVTYSQRSLKEVERNPFRDDASRELFLYSHAVVLASAREREPAKRALLRYADAYPSAAHAGEVYFALGQMYKDEGKVDLASSYLQRAASMKQGSAALRDAADLLLDSGKYTQAIQAYSRLQEAATSDMERQYAQSRIVVALYRSDNIEEAKRKSDAFRSAWPDAEVVEEEFLLEHGKYFFRKGDYRSASDLFDDVEDSDLKALAALGVYWNARCQEAQSRNADARSGYRDVLDDYPQTEAALDAALSLARMDMRAEKFQDAATNYRSVVDAGDIPEAKLKEALNGLIVAYDALAMYDVAAEMTRRFLQTWPADPTAFRKRVNLGLYLTHLRYLDTAIDHFENLLPEASPDDQAEIRYYIGEAYFYKGDFSRSAIEFLKVPYLVVRKTELDWASMAYAEAANCYRELSKFDLAIDMYQKIVDTPGVDPRFRAEAEKRIKEIRALMK